MIGNFLFDLFFDWVPWWAWAAAAAGGLFFVWRFFGFKAMVAAGAAAAVAVASLRGVQKGRDIERTRQDELLKKAKVRRDKIDKKVGQMSEEEIRAQLKKYERKS